MGKPGRNDPCPCGSGKKYKKCCYMNNTSPMSLWKENCKGIQVEPDNKQIIQDTFFGLLEYAQAKNLHGACHTISSALYVLLKEQGISPHLIIGGAGVNSRRFGHSWVEIDGRPFDIAVYKTNDPNLSSPPVFYGYDLSSNAPTKVEYDVPIESGHMRIINQLLAMSISYYMSGEGQKLTFTVWDIVNEVAHKNNLKMDIEDCIEKYNHEKWETGKALQL